MRCFYLREECGECEHKGSPLAGTRPKTVNYNFLRVDVMEKVGI